jgi:diguanylate cyclase (GGDEF)-like protein
MEERPIIADHIAIACTVSIGVAQLSSQDGGIEDLLHRADMALYAAKKGGRNRVEVAQAVKSRKGTKV